MHLCCAFYFCPQRRLIRECMRERETERERVPANDPSVIICPSRWTYWSKAAIHHDFDSTRSEVGSINYSNYSSFWNMSNNTVYLYKRNQITFGFGLSKLLQYFRIGNDSEHVINTNLPNKKSRYEYIRIKNCSQYVLMCELTVWPN